VGTQGNAEIAPGTTLGGKFLVTRTIGAGGMGAVYEVQHTLTRHRRALKLLHPEVRERHPDVVRRFLREASVAGTLGDPHIVETFDAGELPSGEPYLLMELLDGEPLSARLRRGRPSIAECAGILKQLCEAVSVAHARGIVHRDLKPENVFLCAPTSATPKTAQGVPFVKVLDFGISKFDETKLGTDGGAATHEGLALGTPYYMPPEQVRGLKDIDARADVYALGVLLYETITGKRPFEADSMPHLVVLIHEGKPSPIGVLRPETPEALVAIVARAMHPNRHERIATAKELGELLEPFLTMDVSLDATAIASTLRAPDAPSVPDERARSSEAFAATAAATAASIHSTVGMSSTAHPDASPETNRSKMIPIAIGLVVILGGAGWFLRNRIANESRTQEPASSSAPATRPSTTAPVVPIAPSVSTTIAETTASTSASTTTKPSSGPPVASIVAKTMPTASASASTKPTSTASSSSKVKSTGLADDL